MTEKSSDPGQSARPTDFESLYSRAHLQGTRYWDFSSSRKELRGQFRQRIAEGAAQKAAAVPPGQAGESMPIPEFEPPARRGPVRVTEVASERENPPQQATESGQGRWYALHALFSAPAVNVPPPQPMSLDRRPPAVAVFSFAGGVGKTCLVATLGRALAAMGEHVLLADTATCGLLPFYFGSRESKPGVRTFFPSAARNDAPVQVVSLDVERYPNDGSRDALLEELVRVGQRTNRILADVVTGGKKLTSRLLELRPTILVPMLPDMSSVACLGSLEALFSSAAGRNGEAAEALYLLNQFDESSSLHGEVREMLRQRLGGRLLPFSLRRSPAVSEALAEGMTVIDYAPESAAANDFRKLAGWLHSFAAPGVVEYGGARWSEC